MEYEFNPEDYGYQHVSNFPELKELFGNTTYVKITCVGGKEFDRLVYWYTACYSCGFREDQNWKIMSGSHDSAQPEKYSYSTCYVGLISTDDFANQLLMHIFGTTKNDSVIKEGKERLESRIKLEEYGKI